MGPTRVFRVASSRGMSNIWTEGVPEEVNRTELPGEQKRSALRQRRCAGFRPVPGCSPLEGRVLQTASVKATSKASNKSPFRGSGNSRDPQQIVLLQPLCLCGKAREWHGVSQHVFC